MLTHILNEPCPACSVSGRRAIWSRLGLDALDPIEELLNAAQDFSHRHAPSLQHFLHWLAVGDSEIKRELDRGEDAGPGQVRIMTVHASKGLEAPIVFLPDTAGMPRVQDVPKFLWREDGAPLYLAVKPDTGAARRVWNQARARQLEEYRRLLYVALTRASHRLYIGGWEPARQEPDSEGSWHNLVRRGLAQSESHARDTDEGVIVWEDPALPGVATTPPSAPLSVVPLPAWVLRQAPVEKAEAAALAPSQLGATPAAATPDQAFARGRIIHRLLQSLPDVAASRRNDAARRFLMQPQHHLSTAQQDDIRIEVMRLLEHPDYAALFGEHSRAEVPLAGMVGGQNLSGQVDRLAMVGNEVWVVDYKTNRPPPPDITGVPALYRTQMEAYRGLLRAIYPNRVVRCFLLWTYGPRFMEI